jgi:hypothetical protein
MKLLARAAFACIALAMCCAAQTPAGTSTSQLSVSTLLSTCSGNVLPSVINLYLEATVTPVGGSAGAAIIRIKGTDHFRIDYNMPARQYTSSIVAGAGFRLENGTKKTQPSFSTQFYRPEFLPALMCAWSLGNGTDARVLGQETLDGRQVYHLLFRATPKGTADDAFDGIASELHLFIDATTGMVVKSKQWAFSPHTIDNRSVFETTFDDYRPINGLMVPFHITHYSSGSKLDDVVVTSARTDLSFTEADFQ